MHAYVAFLLFPEIQRCDLKDITNDELVWIKKNHKDKRQIAKTAEFAIAYGGNGSTIARNTGQTKKQGELVYKSYFEAFSDLKMYFDLGMKQVERDHYILFNPISNRKLFIGPEEPFLKYADLMGDPSFRNHPERKFIEELYNSSYAEIQRKSQNYRIQGSAADCSKLAGILFFNEIIKRGWFKTIKMINMIHDEFNVEAPNAMAQEVSDLLIKCMEVAAKNFCKIVPLTADPAIGDHWIH